MIFRSRRPYLIQAIYQWATDNPYTPHLLVASDFPGVSVPSQYVQDGRITLNISPSAVSNFEFLQDRIWFSARFGGRAFEVDVPYGAVLAIFARENGEGVVFGEVEPPGTEPSDAGGDHLAPSAEGSGADKPKPSRAHLRVIK